MERWMDGKVDGSKGRIGGKFNGREYFGGSGGRSDDDKPSCSFCAGNHGVWACRKFQGLKLDGMLPRKRICALGA